MQGGENILSSLGRMSTKRNSSRSFNVGTTELVENSSLLKNLLLGLGLTETAKALEMETQLRVGEVPATMKGGGDATENSVRFSAEDFNDGNDFARPNQGAPCTVTAGSTQSDHTCDGRINDVSFEKLLHGLPVEDSNSSLFCALLSSVSENGAGYGGEFVFLRLCKLATSPMSRLYRGAHSPSEEEGVASLSPLLHSLLTVVIGIPDGEASDVSSTVAAAHSTETSIIEIFFAYVELLWTQLCLTEAVALAELAPQRWCCDRQNVVSKLSDLQEKLQLLLLETHQLKSSTTGGVDDCSGVRCGNGNGGSSLKPASNGKSCPSVAAALVAGKSDVADIADGICALFCREESVFRRNMEAVSMWILEQLSRNSAYCLSPEGVGPVSEDATGLPCGDAVLVEEEAAHSEWASPQQRWDRIMDVVRQAALPVFGEATNSSYEVSGHPSQEEKLLCAQTAMRIQFFAWLVGSMAEVSSVLRAGTPRQGTSEADGVSQGKDRECQHVSQGPAMRAAVGIWYHHCAMQLEREVCDFSGCTARSTAAAGSGSAATTCTSPDGQVSGVCGNQERTAACDVQATRYSQWGQVRMEGNIAQLLIEKLKGAAYESLAVSRASPEVQRQLLLCNKLFLDEDTGWLGGNGFCGGSYVHPGGTVESGIRESILEMLISGKSSQMVQRVNRPRPSVHHLLKQAFSKTRMLLSLQENDLPFDVQLKAMENAAARALLLSGVTTVNGLGPHDVNGVEIHSQPSRMAIGRQTSIEETVMSDDAPSIEIIQLADNPNGGPSVAPSWEDSGEILEAFMHNQVQMMRHLLMSSGAGLLSSGLARPPASEGDSAGLVENGLERSDEQVTNEVQVIALTPCGSLLALLTTKGRLIVFSMRNYVNEGGVPDDECQHGKFSERVIIDVLLVSNSSELRWYEQLALLLSFSPCGRFLLCSVQHVSSSGSEQEQVNQEEDEDVGKVLIYSLHCNDDCRSNDVTASLSATSADSQDSADRLYGTFKVHRTPVTVARWVDPRFWQGERIVQTSPSDSNTSTWRRAAHFHLSFLQCLSCGCDNTIIRWNPVNGSVIQSIATFPVQDILFSPLKQAFYTISHYGQLSMYDAWNENNITNPTEGVIEVGQRGLPASLSVKRSSNDRYGDTPGSPLSEITTHSSDSEVPEYFYAGSQTIRFDRRCVARESDEHEPLLTRMSRAVSDEGVPAGVETRVSSRIGRRILRDVLQHDTTHSAPSDDFILRRSCDSEVEGNGVRSNQRQRPSYSRSRPHANQYANPIASLQLKHRHREGVGRASLRICDKIAKQDYQSTDEDVIFYRTGSRLVFVEVPHALCHAARVRPSPKDSRYAAPPEPYHLLSMTASGCPVWGECEVSNVKPTQCRCCHSSKSALFRSPSCRYYSDDSLRRNNSRNDGATATSGHSTGMGKSTESLGETAGRGQFQCGFCRCSADGGSPVIEPTAENGRYLCIMASVGPNRSLPSHEQPLEYNPGAYVCLVFDVASGSVVRVIPVCPTQPHFPLTQNGVATTHPKAKRAPIYLLPCSVAVVPKWPQQRRRSSGMFSSVEAANPTNVFCALDGHGISSYPSPYHGVEQDEGGVGRCDADRSESVVLVAVGGLHSKVHVFNALTGARVKDVNLREDDHPDDVTPATGRRTPTKRARCSYAALADSDRMQSPFPKIDMTESDDSSKESDMGSGTTFSDFSSQQSEHSRIIQHQSLMSDLVERYGVSTVLQSTVDMLSVVPFPFPFRDCQLTASGGNLSAKGLKNSSRLSFSARTPGEAPNSLSGASCLNPCPSFLGQLLSALKDDGVENPTSNARCGSKDVKESATLFSGDTPFEFVSLQSLRRIITKRGTETRSSVLDGDDSSVPLPTAASGSTRFRCGVVNSVALMWDTMRGGVYIFSGDEYGGFFVTGDQINLGA